MTIWVGGKRDMIVAASSDCSMCLWDMVAKELLHQVHIGLYPISLTISSKNKVILECDQMNRKCLSVWTVHMAE